MKTVLHLKRRFCTPTETFIANQINSIQGYKVLVGTMVHTKSLPCTKEICVPSSLSSFSRTAKYLSNRTASLLYDELAQHPIDLIHTHYLVDAIIFHKLTSRFSVPKICSAYGYDVSSFPNKFLGSAKFLYPRIFQEYSRFLAMSEDMKKDVVALGCPESKIDVHYYGTDVSRFLNTSRSYHQKENKLIILSVGTLEEKKAQHLVVRSLALLETKYGISNFEYHLVGAGAYESIVRKEVQQTGLMNRVFFHGYIPHYDNRLQEFYRNADIFILPSMTLNDYDKEGIPGTIVEAMANGLPVISTYHAGIPSIIRHSEEGLLIRERDVEAMAEAIFQLATHPELRERLGKKGQEKAKNDLDLRVGTGRLEMIYDETLQQSVVVR